MSTAETATSPLTCHHCGSSELTLVEFWEHASEWAGLDLVDGVIRPRSEEALHLEPYNTSRKPMVNCGGCKQQWTPRRRIEFP